MSQKLWISLGIGTIIGLMYLYLQDRPYRLAQEARALGVPPEAIEFCPSESHAPHLGSLPAFAGTGLDERPLEFGEPSQDRQYNAWTC
jgi:hypothetical protein